MEDVYSYYLEAKNRNFSILNIFGKLISKIKLKDVAISKIGVAVKNRGSSQAIDNLKKNCLTCNTVQNKEKEVINLLSE